VIYLDRVRAAVVAMVRAEAPAAAVTWAPAGYPERALGDTIVTCRIAGGPVLRSTWSAECDEPTRITWTASGVAVGQRVGIALTGGQWWYEREAGDTDTDVRDALLAKFTGDAQALPGVTVTASGAASIVFDTGGVPGLLWRPSLIGAGSVSLVVDTSVLSAVDTGTAFVTIELQAFAAGRGLAAHALLGAILGSLSSTDQVERRDALGVSLLGTTAPADLTALVGADFQSRAACRLTLGIRSYRAVAADAITEVGFTATTDYAATAGTVTAP